MVENVGAGHHVPTGATTLRALWVDVEVDGAPYPRGLELGDQPTADGAPVPMLTQADDVRRGSVPAGRARRARVPGGERVRAWLRGRAVRPAVLEALGREDLAPQVPTHLVHEARLRAP